MAIDENGAGAAPPRRRRLGERERELIRGEILGPRARGAARRPPSDQEVELFCRRVESTGLDPSARQIYGAYRWNRRTREHELSVEATIDGLRAIAERTGRYEGQTRVRWCGEDGEWRESWSHGEPPVAATVGVHKSGAHEPTWGTAHFVEFAEFHDDSGRPKGMYATMPRNQLAIRAEANALRRAFPSELSGLYAAEEMPAAEGGESAQASEDVGEGRSPEGDGSETPGRVPGGMEAVSRGPSEDGGAPPADPRARARLAAAVERSKLDAETVRSLSRFLYGTSVAERLGEEQLAELTERVEAIRVGGIEEGTLRGQLTKAERRDECEAARAAFDDWVTRRANQARERADGERSAATEDGDRGASDTDAPGGEPPAGDAGAEEGDGHPGGGGREPSAQEARQ